MTQEDGILAKFLAGQKFDFDLKRLMSDDLARLDTDIPPTSLFKYFPSNRPHFFVRPSLRFTQRTELNDPFELSNRWKGVAPDYLKASFSRYIKSVISNFVRNKGLALKYFAEEEAKKGVYFNMEELAQMAGYILSKEGQQRFQAALDGTLRSIDGLVEDVFAEFQAAISEGFTDLTNTWGILSLTEDPANPAMWGLYAEGGKGFIVEFNTSHSFFKANNGRSLLWRVNYKESKSENFFENPAALFLSKHSQFSFEREWRLIKDLRDCDEVIDINGQQMHMCKAEPGMIKSVTFGYNSDKNEFPVYGASLKVLFDSQIQIRLAHANRHTGQIEFYNLDEQA